MPQPNRCEICGEPTPEPTDMCRACGRSLDTFHDADQKSGRSSGMTFAIWAARRARWYAERRAAKNARQAVKRDARRARR